MKRDKLDSRSNEVVNMASEINQLISVVCSG